MRLFEGTPWDRPPRCDQCGQLEAECTCPVPPAARIAPRAQTARVVLEKRSKGKRVTVVRGLSETGNDLPDLLGKLKAQCGAGGTLKDGGVLEVQGDQLARVRDFLGQLGYRVRG